MSNLSEILKKRRVELGLTQNDVSIKVGWSSPQFVSGIENGRVIVPISKIKKYSRVLKMDYSKLYDLIIEEKMKSINKKL